MSQDGMTPRLYRQGILNLMIDRLGIGWAKPNILETYGALNKIPDADLPTVYAKAQADANAMTI